MHGYDRRGFERRGFMPCAVIINANPRNVSHQLFSGALRLVFELRLRSLVIMISTTLIHLIRVVLMVQLSQSKFISDLSIL